MLKIMIRVKAVDHFAFCGREQHPLAEDEGQVGLVLSISHAADETVEEAEEDLSEDYPGQRIDQPERNREDLEDDGPFAYQLLVCKLANGRTVELMGHEIELVSANHDGDLGYSEVL